MLEAARAGDWDAVCRLESASALASEMLRELAERTPLPVHEQKERFRILCVIVANDAQVRRITQPLPTMLDPAGLH